MYFLEGAWFFSSLHDIGARPLPKIPDGARPLPEILEGARPLPEILEGAWCQRRRQSFSVRRAWTWRWPRQCPWSPLSPLVNWHQAKLATGGEGREGSLVSLQAKYLAITATSSLSWAGRGRLQSGWQLWYSFFNDKLKFKTSFCFLLICKNANSSQRNLIWWCKKKDVSIYVTKLIISQANRFFFLLTRSDCKGEK